MATVSALRIRNDRREKKEAKRNAKTARSGLHADAQDTKVQPRH